MHVLFGSEIKITIPSKRLPSKTKLYIAGPQGFMESTRSFHKSIIAVIEAMGGKTLDPWTLTPTQELVKASAMQISEAKVEVWRKLNAVIAKNNINALRKATGVIANLDGTNVDSGTAAEIGIAYQLGIPILGYRGDFRLATDNIGGIVNIQVEEMVRQSASGKGKIITTISDLPSMLVKIWG